MINKSKIKIVKRTDAVGVKLAGKNRKRVSSRGAAREVVSTVTDWVSELKHRKSNETKAALELLFAANRRPSES